LKKVLVFGSSGALGQRVVSQALRQGHDVTAFVRDPKRLAINSFRLRVAIGNTAEDSQSVARAVLAGYDVVISTLGIGRSFRPNGLIERSMRNIVSAMEAAGVRRLVFTSAFGVGTGIRDVPLVPMVFMRTLLRAVYADKKAGEDILRRSDLDWTLVRPTGLTNHPGTGTYRVGEHLELRGFPTVSRWDVAHFIVTQIDDITYVKKEVLVSR